MAIQQSINQLLYNAQIGAGFYAHQPGVQEKRKAEKATEGFKKVSEQLEQNFAEESLIDQTLYQEASTEDLYIMEQEIKGASEMLQQIAKQSPGQIKGYPLKQGMYAQASDIIKEIKKQKLTEELKNQQEIQNIRRMILNPEGGNR